MILSTQSVLHSLFLSMWFFLSSVAVMQCKTEAPKKKINKQQHKLSLPWFTSISFKLVIIIILWTIIFAALHALSFDLVFWMPNFSHLFPSSILFYEKSDYNAPCIEPCGILFRSFRFVAYRLKFSRQNSFKFFSSESKLIATSSSSKLRLEFVS